MGIPSKNVWSYSCTWQIAYPNTGNPAWRHLLLLPVLRAGVPARDPDAGKWLKYVHPCGLLSLPYLHPEQGPHTGPLAESGRVELHSTFSEFRQFIHKLLHVPCSIFSLCLQKVQYTIWIMVLKHVIAEHFYESFWLPRFHIIFHYHEKASVSPHFWEGLDSSSTFLYPLHPWALCIITLVSFIYQHQ